VRPPLPPGGRLGGLTLWSRPTKLKSLSRDSAQPREDALAKNQNTFEKRRREMQKKRKAEEKRERRQKRKEEGDQPVDADADVDAEASVVEEPEAASEV
jgi:hypothetical protein